MSDTTRPLRAGFVPIVRPLFRGAKLGLWEASLATLRARAADWHVDWAYTPEPVEDADGARQRAAEAARAGLDFVLLQHVTFATGDLFLPFLELDVPLGLWALPEATATGPLPQNALCGLNMALSLSAERARAAKWFYGAPDDAGLRAGLETTLRALRGVRALRQGRVLWVGGTAPGFYRLEGVPELPLTIETAPLDLVTEALEAVSEAEVDARVQTFQEDSDYDLPQLRPAARMELALAAVAQGYDGVALRCWPELPDAGGAMTCAGYAHLAERGVPYACEGDVAGLAAMLAAGAFSGEPAALLDLTHVSADDDACLFWHCGNAASNWARADGVMRLLPHFNRGLPAVRDLRLKPGPVSGLRLLEDRRAVVYAGEVLERSDGFEGVSGWVGRLRWAGRAQSAGAFLQSALGHRLPHHFVWARGDHEAALRECCAWLDHAVLPPDPELPEGMVRWPRSSR